MGQQSRDILKTVKFRKAKATEWEAISALHIDNWQKNYRGIYSDKFLDHDVYDLKNRIWEKRLTSPADNQSVIVAEKDNVIVGFSCTYHNYKGEGKHYLDNLHVSSDFQGNGLGKELLYRSAKEAFSINEDLPFYLLVFEKNILGLKFYKRMGAVLSAPIDHQNEDGTNAKVISCTWTDREALRT